QTIKALPGVRISIVNFAYVLNYTSICMSFIRQNLWASSRSLLLAPQTSLIICGFSQIHTITRTVPPPAKTEKLNYETKGKIQHPYTLIQFDREQVIH